jgi:hypothetical protein
MNFEIVFILGAAKSGTTSLHYYLSQHPDICMSEPKEPFFFEAEYERGKQYYLNKYFPHWRGEPVIGEARHRNLYLPYIPMRIKEMFPNAKLLIILRNPVDRAYSDWWHWYSQKVERLPFQEAIRNNFLRIEKGPHFQREHEIEEYKRTLDRRNGYSPFTTYIDSGYYDEQIRRYLDIFGQKKIKIIFFEDLTISPELVLKDIFHFLTLEDAHIQDLQKQNIAKSMMSARLLQFLGKIPGHKNIPKNLKTTIRNKIERMFPNTCPKMNIEIRKELINHYEQHILVLENMTGRNLSSWRE